MSNTRSALREAVVQTPCLRRLSVLLAVCSMACDPASQIVSVDTTPASLVITVAAATMGEVATAPATLELVVGESASLAATALNWLGNPIGGVSVEWSSSAPGVASVSAEGLLLAAAPGATEIDATFDGTRATMSLVVKPAA